MLADALVALDRHAEAEPHLRRLSRAHPRDPVVWFALGKTYEALAGQAFGRLLERDPESPLTLALVAEARLDQGQTTAAFQLYRRALERAPSQRGLHAGVAEVYRRTGHPDWAAAEEEKEKRLAEGGLRSRRPRVRLRRREAPRGARRRVEARDPRGGLLAGPVLQRARRRGVRAAHRAAALRAVPRVDGLHRAQRGTVRRVGGGVAQGDRPRAGRPAAEAGARRHAAPQPGPRRGAAGARRRAARQGRLARGELPAGRRAPRAPAARAGDPAPREGRAARAEDRRGPRGARTRLRPRGPARGRHPAPRAGPRHRRGREPAVSAGPLLPGDRPGGATPGARSRTTRSSGRRPAPGPRPRDRESTITPP